MEDIFSKFIEPENKFKPIPFWSWNDDLEEYEIRRQIREMKKSGYGGYFMHARIGLITPYMGEKWMEMVKTAIDEGNKNGMDSWLYDENKWPSGFAGGAVPKKNVDFRFKYLVCVTNQQIDQILKTQLHSQISQVRDDSFLLHQFNRDNQIHEVTINDITYHLHEWIAPMGDKWYNGTCYIDLMYPETVKYFIESTYQKYYDVCSDNIGKGVPGIFTDEPTIWSHTTKLPFKTVSWTKNFREIFKQINGYDIIPEAIKLFIDHEDYKKVRYDYYKTITDLFVNSYSKQVGEWCKEHKMIFTGHYLMEDNFNDQIIAMSKVMPHYEYETYPGIDMLADRVGLIGTFLTIKQAASVAEQLGKERVLSETYGGGGWNFTITDQKLMAETQLALGVNLLNPHLALYSMRGERKRDFPPSLFYQQPYWEDYKLLNDYLSKLCYILSLGKRQVNILVLHPIESAWLEFSVADRTKINKMNNDFADFIAFMLGAQKDFHVGDETLIEKYGKSEDGKFIIGEYKYDYILLPNMTTLRSTTLKLLESFAESGGKIISLNEFPVLLDGAKPLVSNLKYDKYKKDEFCKQVNELLPQKITIEGKNANNILLHHRIAGEMEIYYLLNNHSTDIAEISAKINTFDGYFEIWDPLKNDRTPFESKYENGISNIELLLHPGESKLLIYQKNTEKILPAPEKYRNELEQISLDGEWKILKSDLNAFTLDFCQYRIDGNGYSKILPVLEVQNQSRSFGGKKITVKYEFEIETYPKLINEIYLICENKENASVLFNGAKIQFNKEDWWVDISFKKASVKDFIRQGVNIIEIETSLDEFTELEAIYMIGDFCLKNYNNRIFSIIRKENILQIADLAKTGYPFFNGKISLGKTFNLPKNDFKKCILRMKKMDSLMVKVTVNDKEAGYLAWNPLELDLTEYVKEGINHMSLTLISSCRNLLGPHHYKGEELHMTHPEHFYDEKKFDGQYSFVPFGLTVAPEIVLFN
jgi:hypothetical protein